jgi:hypothetical protein
MLISLLIIKMSHTLLFCFFLPNVFFISASNASNSALKYATSAFFFANSLDLSILSSSNASCILYSSFLHGPCSIIVSLILSSLYYSKYSILFIMTATSSSISLLSLSFLRVPFNPKFYFNIFSILFLDYSNFSRRSSNYFFSVVTSYITLYIFFNLLLDSASKSSFSSLNYLNSSFNDLI